MSTVRLKKAYEGKRPGEEISVPYGKGKELITLGIAEYPTAAPEPAKSAVPGVPKAEMEAAIKRIRALEEENKEVKAEASAADKRVKELEAEFLKLKKA